MVNVRVRGIHATALAKILLERGFNIVHASKKIKERFKIVENRIPPDVTIKDLEEKHGVIVLGEYEKAEKVYNTLLDVLPETFSWKSKIPHHAIVKGIVIKIVEGKSIIDLGGIHGELDEELNVGEEVIVDINRPLLPPSNIAKLSRRYTVHGKYSALIYGLKGKVIVSRHIIDPKVRRNLQTLASLMKIEGNWGIKWRSSAVLAGIDDLMMDVQETLKKAEEILKKAEKASPGEMVYKGRFFGIIGFTSTTRKYLDNVRNEILPTIMGHHMLKSMDNNMVNLVDYTEYLLSKFISNREKLSEGLMEYLIENLKERRRIEIEHISLLGNEVKTLTPGSILTVKYSNGEIYGVVKRVFRSKGIFDGLNIPKERGDYDIMEFSTNGYVLLHKYYSKNGVFKGIYVNINTPPEISCGKIRYYDLEIDVVMAADKEPKIIDSEKLNEALSENIVSEHLFKKYRRIAENILKYLEKHSMPEKLSLEELLENVGATTAKLKNF